MKKIILFITSFIVAFAFCIQSSALGYSEYHLEYENEVDSKSILMVDTNNNEVIYSKNENIKMPIASITKIMTYIVATDYIKDLDNTFIVVKEDYLKELPEGAVSVGFKNHINESFSATDILRAMIIESSDDATQIITKYIEETYHINFVKKMNKKAFLMKLYNTYFEDAYGLSENNISNATELYYLVKAAFEKPYFKEIVKTETYLIPGFEDVLTTTNRLIDKEAGKQYFYEYATGIKTGAISVTGPYNDVILTRDLISIAEKGNKQFMIIALGATLNDSNPIMGDTIGLYNWAFSNLAESIDISTPKAMSIRINGKAKISYTSSFGTLDNLKWTSSDSNVVEVDENGNIYGKKLGNAYITVETISGDKAITNVSVGYYNGLYVNEAYGDFTIGEKEDINWKKN